MSEEPNQSSSQSSGCGESVNKFMDSAHDEALSAAEKGLEAAQAALQAAERKLAEAQRNAAYSRARQGAAEDAIPVEPTEASSQRTDDAVTRGQGQAAYPPPAGQPYGQADAAGAQSGAAYYPSPVQPHYATSAASRDHVAAGLLAIFLGGFGVHKFYLGYSTQGFITLAVFLLGGLLSMGLISSIMWVICIVEGIIYLTKSQSEFERVYVFGKREWF